MTHPVDLTNLRSMTDGDADMEKELFEAFYASFKTGIATLLTSTQEASAETWRKEAHALKGIALNLGAEKLGELCKQAQDENHMDAAAKHQLLNQIQKEYESVKQFLFHTCNAL